MEVEGPRGQGLEKGDLGQTVGEQKPGRETKAATEQRVRVHHEGSDELEGSDSKRETGAKGDKQVATAKEEAQAAEGGGTLLSQHSSYSGSTCRIPAAPQALGPAAEGPALGQKK